MSETVQAAITLTVGDEQKTFAATGETTGQAWRLAAKLVESAAGDALDWTEDRGAEIYVKARAEQRGW